MANIIWGVGTALGEVPPYLVARAAAMRGAGKRKSQRVAAQTHDIKVAEFVAEQTGTEDGGVFYKIQVRIGRASRRPLPFPARNAHSQPVPCQTWMVYVLQSHGFWALVLLASIPNPAFDLCGMCCGTFQMALPTFLGGVLVGKGIVKPLWQCALFTIIFHVQTRAVFADKVGGALQLVLPQSAQAKRRLHDALAALSAPSRGVRLNACARCHPARLLTSCFPSSPSPPACSPKCGARLLLRWCSTSASRASSRLRRSTRCRRLRPSEARPSLRPGARRRGRLKARLGLPAESAVTWNDRANAIRNAFFYCH